MGIKYNTPGTLPGTSHHFWAYAKSSFLFSVAPQISTLKSETDRQSFTSILSVMTICVIVVRRFQLGWKRRANFCMQLIVILWRLYGCTVTVNIRFGRSMVTFSYWWKKKAKKYKIVIFCHILKGRKAFLVIIITFRV